MSLWRIRIAMSDDRRSQELLEEALAGQRVCSRMKSPHDSEMTVDLIIELADVTGLSALLGRLHVISPQVFVSSADQSSPLTAVTAVPLERPQRNVTQKRRVPAPARRAYSES